VFLFWCAGKVEVAERLFFIDMQIIEEPKLAIYAMAEHDVPYLMGQNGRQARFIGRTSINPRLKTIVSGRRQ
jgi:hypothetical protein